MRVHGLASALFALGAFFAACSNAPAQPPVLGGCSSDAGGCGSSGSVGTGGGSGSSSGGDAGECGYPSTASQCDLCVGEHCCTQVESCENSTTCEQLQECISLCGGGSRCTTSCESSYPAAASLYTQVTSCANTQCPICSESGIGDPCATTASCVTGLTCMGPWCTETCANDAACTGIGENGGNYTGHANACLHFVNGNYCVPGCASDTDCTTYFPGTACSVATNLAGATVYVCANALDGGY